MLELQTPRLLLRNYRLTDVPEVHAYFSLEEVARYEDFDPMTPEEVAEELSEWKDMDNRLAVVLKETGRVIGSVGYWVEDDGEHSIDFDFNPAYGGKGYATEAAAELVRWLFEEKGIAQLHGDCDVRNLRSQHLMKRLGFVRVKRLDGVSYKDGADGRPLPISIYLYLKKA